MSLTIGSGRTIANWTIRELRGGKAIGSYRLFVDLSLSGPGGPEDTVLTGLAIRVSASGQGAAEYLGRFVPCDGPVIYNVPPHGWDHSCSLEKDFNQRQIEALEEEKQTVLEGGTSSAGRTKKSANGRQKRKAANGRRKRKTASNGRRKRKKAVNGRRKKAKRRATKKATRKTSKKSTKKKRASRKATSLEFGTF